MLGPLRLRVGDAAIDGPEMRRSRVRALLSLLALGGAVRRDRVTEGLHVARPRPAGGLAATCGSRCHGCAGWSSRAGHRATPRRGCGSTERRSRWPAPPQVEVDLWELRDHVVAAEQWQLAGDSTQAARHLEQANALWRGDPLADLQGLVEIDRRSGAGAPLARSTPPSRLGELRLVAGEVRRVAHVRGAGQGGVALLRAGPPAGGRGAAPAGAAPTRARHAAVAEAEASMLAELGLEPEPATAMLLRQARARLDAAGPSSEPSDQPTSGAVATRRYGASHVAAVAVRWLASR